DPEEKRRSLPSRFRSISRGWLFLNAWKILINRRLSSGKGLSISSFPLHERTGSRLKGQFFRAFSSLSPGGVFSARRLPFWSRKLRHLPPGLGRRRPDGSFCDLGAGAGPAFRSL